MDLSSKVSNLIHVGVAVSEENRIDRTRSDGRSILLPIDAMTIIHEYRKLNSLDHVIIEFQPETNFSELDHKNYWFRIPNWQSLSNPSHKDRFKEVFDNLQKKNYPDNLVGVHQTIKGFDVLHPMQKDLTVHMAKKGLDFANSIAADYFVVHLCQVDHWDWDRKEQVKNALRAYKDISDHYVHNDYKFVVCIENLEYPKFPATAHEIKDIYYECKNIAPSVPLKIALDLSHLSRSRSLILENSHKKDIPDYDCSAIKAVFTDYLEYTLNHVLSAKGGMNGDEIFLYHIGGCWKERTHEVPGLSPEVEFKELGLDKNLEMMHDYGLLEHVLRNLMKLDAPAHEYEIMDEMNVKTVFDLILKHTIINNRPLNMILEIYNRPYEEVLVAGKIIREDLINKTVKIYNKYKMFIENIDKV